MDGTQQDVGHRHAAVDANYQADPTTVAFNPAYLADGVAGVTSSQVVIELLDELRPAMVTRPSRTATCTC